jgi:hypothetical protein
MGGGRGDAESAAETSKREDSHGKHRVDERLRTILNHIIIGAAVGGRKEATARIHARQTQGSASSECKRFIYNVIERSGIRTRSGYR